MKRVFTLLIVLLMAISIPLQHIAITEPLQANAAAGPGTPGTPDIPAASAVLIDAKTKEILYEKNPHDKRPMASTTKIMTALVAIERGNLEDEVTVNPSALGPGSKGGLGLRVGERFKLRELLYAALLPSANDGAVAIADHVGGSVEGFAAMMNERAASIGAYNTHYTNPHGLDEDLHYSTAYDLAIIARAALQNQTFSEISSTQRWGLNRSGVIYPIKNYNTLLSTYPGATGGKTGYTNKAGNCLVFSATRGDVSLIGVVLNTRPRATLFSQSSALLDYGFSLYEDRHLISKDVAYKKITSKYGQEIELVAAGDANAIVNRSLPVSIETPSQTDVDAPIKKGTVLGKIIAYQSGRMIAVSDLVAKEDVEPPSVTQLTDRYVDEIYEPDRLKGKLPHVHLLGSDFSRVILTDEVRA